MPTIEERLRTLADENLEAEGRSKGQDLDLNKSFRDIGVSSMDAVAFVRLVMQEFNVQIPPEVVAGMSNLQGLVDYLEANAS